jgi:hypothetical protein
MQNHILIVKLPQIKTPKEFRNFFVEYSQNKWYIFACIAYQQNIKEITGPHVEA